MHAFQSYLIGIVVPDPEVFVNWVKERGIVGSYEELCQNPVSSNISVFVYACVFFYSV